MSRAVKTLFYLCLLCASFCISKSYGASITGFKLSSNIIDLDKFNALIVSYKVEGASNSRIKIYDARDILIKEIKVNNNNDGIVKAKWDASDMQGVPVPPEEYRIIIEAEDSTGNITKHDLTDLTNNKTLDFINFRWDKEKKQFHYTLKEHGRIVLRAGIDNGGPLLNTIANWELKQAGSHIDDWDGLDQSGVLDISQHPKLLLAKDGYALADNSVMVVSSKKEQGFIASIPWGISRRDRAVKQTAMYRPMQQPADKRGDFPLYLALAKTYSQHHNNLPVVSGIVPIRLDVDRDIISKLASQRFEPVFYENGRFIFENEVGFFPTTFRWDTRHLNKGEHYITANLRGDRSNFGMATIKVYVDNNLP